MFHQNTEHFSVFKTASQCLWRKELSLWCSVPDITSANSVSTGVFLFTCKQDDSKRCACIFVEIFGVCCSSITWFIFEECKIGMWGGNFVKDSPVLWDWTPLFCGGLSSLSVIRPLWGAGGFLRLKVTIMNYNDHRRYSLLSLDESENKKGLFQGCITEMLKKQ